MGKSALCMITSVLLLAAVPPADAGLGRRCKHLCRDRIASCIEAAACDTLPTRRERHTCKKSCKQPIIDECKLDLSACPQGTTTSTTLATTTTTTLPGSCPAFTSTCQETGDLSVLGLGDHACVDGKGDLPLDTTTVFVSFDGTDAANASVNANVTGADFGAGILCQGPLSGAGGSLVVEQTGGDPVGTAGCCSNGETRILHCRATIDLVCAAGEDIAGSLQIDAECVGEAPCSTRVTFLATRN